MKPIFVVTFCAAILFTVRAQAQQQPAKPAPEQQAKPEATKIGVVDFARALGDTAEGQREFAGMQNWINQQQEALKKEQSEYEAMRNRYMQDQLKMSPEVRSETERQIQDRETKLRRKQEDLNQELGLRRQAIVSRLGIKFQQIIQQYAQENNYLMILVAQEGLMAYLAPSADLTTQLVKLYDAKHPAASPPATPKKP